ncbi:TPA: hypothetical protein DCX16_03175 [bacterium]|nr:hypothetical protein [bacterium]
MARKKKEEEHKCETAGGLRWLITYADMITLLLGVFIILVSTSALHESKYNAMRIAFARVFSLFAGTREEGTMPGPAGSPFPDKSGAQIEFPEAEKHYKQQVAKGYKEERTMEKVQLLQTRSGMIFRIPEILFDEGSSELSPKYLSGLDKIGKFIEKIPNLIRIEGHTDAKPVLRNFSSNWHLSIERANSVREYLFRCAKKRLSPDEFDAYQKRFAIVGFGYSKPISKDIYSPENRRVDVVIIEESPAEIKRKILSE